MSAQKPATWAYSEEFIAEDEVMEAARLRGAELGCSPVMASVGAVLRLLAAAAQARAVVEVGTGAGVSGLWLLSGMPSDGILTTIDIEAEHQRAAKSAYTAAGIAPQRTRVITGPALEVLPRLTDAASPASKQADLFWMNDLWQRYLGDIASARHLDAAKLAADIDDLPNGLKAAGGDAAQWALNEKLVDALKTSDEVETMLEASGVKDTDIHSFRQVDLGDYLAHLGSAQPALKQPRVAVVVAEGEIGSGEQPPGKIGGDSTAALIERARNDDTVKALVLRVDSPGGEVFPSEQIRRQIELTRSAGIPVVVSMGNVAASGGYWISMNANRIYADPSTISGSIGSGLAPNALHAL